MRLGLSFHKVEMIANLIVQVEALRIRMPAAAIFLSDCAIEGS